MVKNLNLGQHFLINPDIIKQELKVANITKKDKILEVGAGEGILTKELLKKTDHVLAFEIDKNLQQDQVPIIYDNALNHSWQGYKIVANIPYYLSEQIMVKAIKDNVTELTLIVGEKFKHKLTENKTKIGILSNLHYNIEPVLMIEKENFSPQPRVNSWLIKLKLKTINTELEKKLILILQRKGKLKNSLLNSFTFQGKTKNEAREIINQMDLNQQSLEKPVSKITDKLLLRLLDELKKIYK
jgi:16S rRNA (adenine1518-N6/adenine1519-N6)-dimethyltransferase